MKAVDLSTSIQTEAGEMSLDIVIGNGQIGSSAVTLGGQIIATGDIGGCSLGSGKELVGKVLVIKSMVTDVNDATNKTSLEYVFRKGATSQKFQSTAEVDRAGDAVIYRSQFTFI